MRNWCIPIVLSVALSAHAAPPQRVEIVYEVTRNGTPFAEVTERLEHDRKQYRLEETWKGKGVLALRGEAKRMSRGAIAADGLRPAEFEDRRPGREPKSVGFTEAAPALERQDRLSLVWNFVFVPPRAETVVRVADHNGVSIQTFKPAGRERLSVPAGEFNALKIVRKKDEPGSRTTELWLAADRSYLPVKISITEKDGTRLEQVAVRITAQ